MKHRTVLGLFAVAGLVLLAVACAGKPDALDADPGEPRIREEHPVSSPRPVITESEPAAEETADEPEIEPAAEPGSESPDSQMAPPEPPADGDPGGGPEETGDG